MDDLLQSLNEQQKCAVTSPHPILQVLAPPGSGKTKTLTARVAYLIAEQGYKPCNIIVCTFTVKAAREMKERIRGIVGEELEAQIQLGTFHSIARRFLVSYGHMIGIKRGFGIADTSDTKAIIKRIHKRLRSPLEPSTVGSRISKAKAKKLRPADFYGSKKLGEQDLARFYEEYEATLKSSNLLDYDDILLRCVELLQNHPECVANVEAVLIDEFQDTNKVQYELMMLFARYRKHITIVGDPDQSIYSFRAAEIENLNRMTRDLKGTLSIHLEQNYRSSGAILRCASRVIQQDVNRIKKPLVATHGVGLRPVLRKLPSATDEAEWIVAEIKRIRTLSGCLFHNDDFAILIRSSVLSLKIETSLGKAGIPYRVVGGLRFFDRKEIRILLDYLRVINQPNHNDALARVINEPPRKIGEATLRDLLEEAETKKVSLWSLVLALAQCRGKVDKKISAAALKGMQTFVNIILTCQSKIKRQSDESFSLVNLIGTVIDKIDFRSFLLKKGAGKDEGEDFESRWANVEELLVQAAEISAIDSLGLEYPQEDLLEKTDEESTQFSPLEETLAQFLSNVALSSNSELKDADGLAKKQVTISTLHAAKGLEWPVVFIAGAYDGSIPHSRAEDTDEERRLLYVGMTRAQSLLYLSCPLNGSRESDSEHALSQFLAVPELEPFFLQQGPSLSITVIEDLARILRRDCPSDRMIIEGAMALERMEDDLYPLDGSRLGFQNKGWDVASNMSGARPFKRPRLQDAIPASGVLVDVTATNTGAYSISSTTLPLGFISAGAKMKQLEESAAATSKALRAKQGAEVPAKLKKPGATFANRKTQGSITAFFGAKNTVKAAATESCTVHDHFIRDRGLSSRPVLGDQSPPRKQANLGVTASPNRTIRRFRVPGRPSAVQHEETGSEKGHILLSSSPTRGDTIIDEDATGAGGTNGASEEHGAMPSTFHMTTMDQMNSSESHGQRRTLGMRRPLQGWSSKVNQPFSAPSRIR